MAVVPLIRAPAGSDNLSYNLQRHSVVTRFLLGPNHSESLLILRPRKLSTIAQQFYVRDLRQSIFLSTAPTTRLVELVIEGKLDGAFVAGPINQSELDEERFLTEELVLIGPSSLPTLEFFHTVSNLKLIGFHRECAYRQRLDLILQEMNLKYKVMEFDSLQSLMSCVGQSAGITLLPKFLAKRFTKHQNILIHRLPKEKAMREIVFIRRRDRSPSVALLALLEMTREVCHSGPRMLSRSIS